LFFFVLIFPPPSLILSDFKLADFAAHVLTPNRPSRREVYSTLARHVDKFDYTNPPPHIARLGMLAAAAALFFFFKKKLVLLFIFSLYTLNIDSDSPIFVLSSIFYLIFLKLKKMFFSRARLAAGRLLADCAGETKDVQD
jgi:hypothetical protein